MGIIEALRDKQFREGVGQGLVDVAQGASNAAASNLSVPVDVLAWALRKAGVPVPDNPMGGSDWMAQKGLTREPVNKAAGMAGEIVGGVAPFVMAQNAPKIAGGLLNMGKNLAAPATMNKQAGAIVMPGNESLLTALERNGVPLQKPFEYPQDKALETARQNGVKMLGLPENNTAMDRARALGFDTDVFHGSKNDFHAFDLQKSGVSSMHASSEIPAVWTSGSPKVANIFASKNVIDKYPISQYGQKGAGLDSIKTSGIIDGGNVMPLMLRGKPTQVIKAGDAQRMIFGPPNSDWREAGKDFADYFNKSPQLTKIKGHPSANLEFRANQYLVSDPAQLRSRFAAFDPARVNENNLLAGALPFTAMLDDETRTQMIDRLRALTDSKAKKK